MTAISSNREIGRRLRILHILRAPLGGLFRHVIDLSREQAARGHAVGLVADSLTGGTRAEAVLSALKPSLELGLVRLPMRREPHISDIWVAAQIARHTRALNVDVAHGHGSKGGAFARLPGFLPRSGMPVRAYTPHGGSFNYRAGPFVEASYMTAERVLAHATDVFLFESAYIAGQFNKRVGKTSKLVQIVANGLSPDEFVPVEPNPDAADLLYVGELRAAKGIDTLIDALALLSAKAHKMPRLVLVGSGPDEAKLVAQAQRCGVGNSITFAGLLPARDAFRLGRILVVPSRAESLPYIVLEAAAAQVPLISTNVGGIGEIFGPYVHQLIACDDPKVLENALETKLGRHPSELRDDARALATFVATRFKISDMADAVLAGYAEAIAAKMRRDKTSASLVLPLDHREERHG